ncbi:hypothetical protein QNO07_07820 [Streptomyces sp. 549]|uniref:uridine kinase family protein n=1 Tax=Streptomyces sp. 549 TaxID=3049076 RepID=UPI0024C2A6F8|nr:hypothetical protein [Streptomyces sp. 549]MDK1473328.1 hypothetical protein [Streptomyces sp. 549]
MHEPNADRRPRQPAPAGLAELAAELRTAEPSCGPVRVVAVDGHAGSGKSTFAGRLAAKLGGAPVVRLDDLASHDALFGWTDRLLTQVLDPLSRGVAARYRVYDWHLRAFSGERVAHPAGVVLLEGVGAGRREVRDRLARVLWMDRDAAASWTRGRHRDGPELAEFWDEWVPAEQRHFASDPTRPHAHLLVREKSPGYEVLLGPAGRRSEAPELDGE